MTNLVYNQKKWFSNSLFNWLIIMIYMFPSATFDKWRNVCFKQIFEMIWKYQPSWSAWRNVRFNTHTFSRDHVSYSLKCFLSCSVRYGSIHECNSERAYLILLSQVSHLYNGIISYVSIIRNMMLGISRVLKYLVGLSCQFSVSLIPSSLQPSRSRGCFK